MAWRMRASSASWSSTVARGVSHRRARARSLRGLHRSRSESPGTDGAAAVRGLCYEAGHGEHPHPRPGGPGDRRPGPEGDRAPGGGARAHRLGELRQPGGDGGRRLGPDQQVRGGLPGQALLRRLRVRGPGGDPGHRAGEEAVRRRGRERSGALRQPGQHGRVHVGHAARRHDAQPGPQLRRAPHPRDVAQLLREALQGRALRPRPGHGAHRLWPGAIAGEGAPAEDHRGRRVGLSADPRLRDLPRDRRLGRRGPGGRHGPHRRPGGDRAAPLAGAAGRAGHDHHPQDAPRPAGWHGPGEGAVHQGREQQHLPRHPGRAADARHRRQGGRASRRRSSRSSRPTSGRSSPMPRPWPRRCCGAGCAWSRAGPTPT